MTLGSIWSRGDDLLTFCTRVHEFSVNGNMPIHFNATEFDAIMTQ